MSDDLTDMHRAAMMFADERDAARELLRECGAALGHEMESPEAVPTAVRVTVEHMERELAAAREEAARLRQRMAILESCAATVAQLRGDEAAERDRLRAEVAALRLLQTEPVAATIIALGLATGHGDTAEDMIAEARAQLAERDAERDRTRAALGRAVALVTLIRGDQTLWPAAGMDAVLADPEGIRAAVEWRALEECEEALLRIGCVHPCEGDCLGRVPQGREPSVRPADEMCCRCAAIAALDEVRRGR